MDARSSVWTILALLLTCTSASGNEPDYEAGVSTETANLGAELQTAATWHYVGADCTSQCMPICNACDACEPWRLFPQCRDGEGINLHGWIAAGFVGNTSSPDSRFNGPYNAVDRANEGMLNQIYFIAEKKLPSDGCHGIGGRVDVIYGEDFFLAQSVGMENHDDGSPHWNSQYYGLAIPQAYVEMGRSDLSLKLGHFYSIIGYEGLPGRHQLLLHQGLQLSVCRAIHALGRPRHLDAERLLGNSGRPDQRLGYARSRAPGQSEYPGQSEIHGRLRLVDFAGSRDRR